MADIDLIPQSYRDSQRIQRTLKSYLLVCLLLVAIVAALRGTIYYLNESLQPEIARLKTKEALSVQQLAQLDQLRAAKQKAEKQWQILQGLRGKPIIDQLFSAVDTALPGSLWFDDIKYMREGQFVDVKPETRNVGYFIVVPKDEKNPAAGEQGWRVARHVEIRGQAADHRTLTGFIGNLGAQPGISNVKLMNTMPREYGNSQTTEFTVVATIDTGAPKK
ncbi:MAG: PilN domain-containing protein [Burkholderiales bacterium]